MFGMETTAGAAEMNEIAERTKDQYRVILRNGKTVEGEEVFISVLEGGVMGGINATLIGLEMI